MATQAKAGNFELFEETMKAQPNDEYKEKRLGEIVAGDFRAVPESIPQVTLDQVKEKFGTLRFYYSGGDDVIDGMVRMAESMTEVTCEGCGNIGERRGGGWIHTYCTPCEEARELTRQKANEEYEFKKLLKEGNEQ
jgi:hypothetical protein